MGIVFVSFPERVGGVVVPSEHDTRQRAVICQDCWFWREMSCALRNPENGVCANRRPIRGRQARPAAPEQAQLVPLAEGHAAELPAVAAVAAPVPFASSDPEATFSLAQLREPATARMPAPTVAPVATPIPRFSDIRAGRAAAAAVTPIAQVRVQVDDHGREVVRSAADGLECQPQLPGMDQMVQRVNRRVAERMSARRGMALSTA